MAIVHGCARLPKVFGENHRQITDLENSPVFQTKGLGEPNPYWDDSKKMVTQSFQLKSCPMSMCKKMYRNILKCFVEVHLGKSTLALSLTSLQESASRVLILCAFFVGEMQGLDT